MVYDIIIIGSGFAGMTAALYAARNGMKTVVFEKYFAGGQIINTVNVENYPGFKSISGFDLAEKLKSQVMSFGIDIKNEEIVDVNFNDVNKVIQTKKGEYISKTVIVSVGCISRKMGCQNEDAFEGKGISYCATCDGHFFKDKDVCVVGGGNTALEDAIYLSGICKTVYVVHRRDEFRGDTKTVEVLENKKNVKFILDSEIISVSGTNFLEYVTVKNKKTTEETKIPVNGVFVAIGQIPSTEIFADVLELDGNGYIVSNENCTTNIPGIFVAGDVRTKKLRQLITAAADGAVSASEAAEYISRL